MTQKTSPFLEGSYGWDYGESGWNSGMDNNLLKFSFLFDRNVDGIVTNLPAAVNGQSWFLLSDKRLYFAVNNTYYSSPTPKWFEFVIKSTGIAYQFNGVDVFQIESNTSLDTRLSTVELGLTSLGTAAFENKEFFATQDQLDVTEALSQNYTDTLRLDISSALLNKGASSVGYLSNVSNAVGRTVGSKLNDSLSVKDFGAKGDGLADDTVSIQNAISYVKSIRGTLYFPQGTYKISSTINLAGVDNVAYIGDNAIIHNVGSGPVVVVDAGAFPGYNDNITFKGFILKGNINSTYGLYTRGHIRSIVEDIRVLDVAIAGFKFDWSVLNNYKNLFLSGEFGSFNVIPAKGLILDQSGSAKSTANVFTNCVFEAPISSHGIDIVAGDINTFIGGSSESVPTGIAIRAISNRNHFLSFDCEGNSVLDVDDSGTGTVYTNSSFSSSLPYNIILEPTSSSTVFTGGYVSSIALNSAQIGSVLFNGTQFNDSLGITGTGAYQAFGCNKVNSSLVPTAEQDSGSFTPSIVGSTTPGTQTYSTRLGYYQRVGRVIHFEIQLVVSSNTGGAGIAILTGLPFASKNITGLSVEHTFTTNTGVSFTGGTNRLVSTLSPNTATGVLQESISGKSITPLPIGSIGAGTYSISGAYIGV